MNRQEEKEYTFKYLERMQPTFRKIAGRKPNPTEARLILEAFTGGGLCMADVLGAKAPEK